MQLQQEPATAHRIQTLRFEFDGPDEALLLRLRTRVEDLCEGVLPEILSDVLDDLAGDDELLEIERLDIDLGELAAADLDPSAIAVATRRALSKLPPARTTSAGDMQGGPANRGDPDAGAAPAPGRRPIAAHRLEMFTGYLLHGDFGAGDPATRPQDLLDETPAGEEVIEGILSALRAAPPERLRGAVMRLLATAPRGLIAALAARMRAAGHGAGAQLLAGTGGNPGARAEAVLAALWPAKARRGPQTEDPDARDDGREAPGPAGEARPLLRAPNAGVVLLHVFLPQLFRRLELLEERRFRDSAARATGVRLVHYLASGDTASEEPLLVVPRLLCGLGPETPVLEQAPIDPAHVALADRLVESAIGHWTKLGNTSAEGLRETFLTRPGIIRGFPDRPRLIVESRGVDVLLGSMPWALSPVRLPWLKHPLPVDWR